MKKEIKKDHITYFDDNGEYHREDGPAIEYIDGQLKGFSIWYFHGKLHNLDGPAVIRIDGYLDYWINNENYGYEQWKQIIKYKAFI